MAVTGLHYAATRPSLGRLAHIRAVTAIRLSLQASDAYRDGKAWWRCERRIRKAGGWGKARRARPRRGNNLARHQSCLQRRVLGHRGGTHPQAGAPHRGHHSGLLTLTDHDQPSRPPRYDRVIYLCDAPARPVVDRAAAALPDRLTARLAVRDLPAGAVL
jgi:hypothetical protein